MSLVLEGAIPPPHLLQSRSASWPYPFHSHDYPAPASSPTSMSPQSLHSYLSRMPGSPVPSQEFHNMPASGWYGPSIPAPECHSEPNYASYGQYIPPHTSSIELSPPTPDMQYSGKPSVSAAQIDPPPAAISPVSAYSRDSVVLASTRSSEEPQPDLSGATQRATKHFRARSHLMDRPNSSSAALRPAPVEVSWPMSPLGIHSSHDPYYPAFPTMTRSPRLSEPLIEQLPSSHLTSPQTRRMYMPIAPQPMEVPRSHGVKRFPEEDDDAVDEVKRRKRSDSNTSVQFELSEEDKLLLRLKEEESMPWKDIAVRFQADLGKTYQIPALQMRLKRLRERMRVWTEADVRALRMAHEYWAQNKFDIISQKMLEFGAQEKWTARQCARKWAEIDPGPTPYAHYEQHLPHGFAPYAMSPIEPSQAFLSYMHVS
ncbi:Nn.00g010480.m01.CDS01 [Neocucurbitaria sp. VM-36]